MRLGREEPWQQVMVGQHAQQGLSELRQHLTDPLIARCLSLGGWAPPGGSMWRRLVDRLAQAGQPPVACWLMAQSLHASMNAVGGHRWVASLSHAGRDGVLSEL